MSVPCPSLQAYLMYGDHEYLNMFGDLYTSTMRWLQIPGTFKGFNFLVDVSAGGEGGRLRRAAYVRWPGGGSPHTRSSITLTACRTACKAPFRSSCRVCSIKAPVGTLLVGTCSNTWVLLAWPQVHMDSGRLIRPFVSSLGAFWPGMQTLVGESLCTILSSTSVLFKLYHTAE